MKKCDEVALPNSCLNKAHDDELIFVLLARDVAATVAVKAWVEVRILAGKNKPDDPQILEALDWCKRVDSATTPLTYWTDEECVRLNAYQMQGQFHPYTCGTDSRHTPLIATRHGWRCVDCGYRQDWYVGGTTEMLRTEQGKTVAERVREEIERRKGEGNGMANIVGKWPGDETDEQIDKALENLS